MKKLIITLVATTVCALTASAQNWYYGGGASIDISGVSTNSHDLKTNGGSFYLGISPEIGYNFNESIAAGAYLNFGFDIPFGGGSSIIDFSINPYFRWNFLKIGDKVKLLADAVLTIGSMTPSNGTTNFVYGLNIRPGVSYAFNERCTLVAHFARLGFNGNSSDGFNSINYGLGATLSPSVSVYWAF